MKGEFVGEMSPKNNTNTKGLRKGIFCENENDELCFYVKFNHKFEVEWGAIVVDTVFL
jgi:hypothetical protein